MLIQYASDLHLDRHANKKYVTANLKNLIKPTADILILGGDIVKLNSMDDHADFFSYVSDNFKTVYWVPGNHEYYDFDLSMKCGRVHENISDNVLLVNNVSVPHEDATLIFSTLWSRISMTNRFRIERSINDFKYIRYRGRKLNASDINELHTDSVRFLENELSINIETKKVVVSHHVPTLMNFPPEYKGEPESEAFVSEQFDMIELLKPSYWIYGHHHRNIPEFTIGETRMITNQLGYVDAKENSGFNQAAVISL